MDIKLFSLLTRIAFISGTMLSPAQAQFVPPSRTTDIPGVKIITPPPAGFDPISASPTEREKYAIPPAPDAIAAPRAYNEWKKVMLSPHKRHEAPSVAATPIYHGPVRKVGLPDAASGQFSGSPQSSLSNSTPGASTNSIVTATSTNWSGSAIVDNSNPFTLEAIIGEFTVPVARQAFGTCSGTYAYSALWVGIDGDGSSDVLQAGVEADAYCSLAFTEPYYSAWIEWYPAASIRVSSPTIDPGDVVYVEVWNGGPTTANAYFYNFSNQETATYSLTAPSGTQLRGNSVEWVVERPEVGNSLATLTNYLVSSWPFNVAWNFRASNPVSYWPNQAATGTLELISMLDSSGKIISHVTPQNYDFLFFTNAGSSFGTGIVPYYE